MLGKIEGLPEVMTTESECCNEGYLTIRRLLGCVLSRCHSSLKGNLSIPPACE